MGFSETGKLIWFAVAYLLWDTVYTLTDVPAYSMLNTMTDNLQERNTLLSVNRVFSGGGYLLCVVVMPLLIGKSYALAVIVLSVISDLTMVPLCIFCGGGDGLKEFGGKKICRKCREEINAH
jgi:Na+/melibiose symporter-like transporter